jgi:hypothetical protein
MSDFDHNIGRLLHEFLLSDRPPTATLLVTLGLSVEPRFPTEFDRLVFVFQHIPERAALYLARAFLRHPDLAISKIKVQATYSDLVGIPEKCERKDLTGFPVAFWAEGWKLAKCAALRMQKNRVHGDSETAFQKYCTIRILEVLSNPPTSDTKPNDGG